jgi:hypothetical protein
MSGPNEPTLIPSSSSPVPAPCPSGPAPSASASPGLTIVSSNCLTRPIASTWSSWRPAYEAEQFGAEVGEP